MTGFFEGLFDIFRKTGTSHGENIWQGFKYELPMKSPKVQGFVLNSEGMYKLIMNNPEPQLINHLGPTEEKQEREFYQPVGKKLIMEIQNTGI